MLSCDFLNKSINGFMDAGRYWIIYKEGRKLCKISKMGNDSEKIKIFFGISEFMNSNNELVKINFECRFCLKTIIVEVKSKDYNEWLVSKSKEIKEAFPYLNKEDQEFLRTKICKNCYQKLLDVWR